jgi:hypothetical protein
MNMLGAPKYTVNRYTGGAVLAASAGARCSGDARLEECGAQTGGRGPASHTYGGVRRGARALWSTATTSRHDTRLHMAVYPSLTAFISKFLN